MADETVATYHEAREKKRRGGRPYAMTIGKVRFESIASFRAHLAPVRLKLLTGPDATNRLRQRRARSRHTRRPENEAPAPVYRAASRLTPQRARRSSPRNSMNACSGTGTCRRLG